MQSRMGGSEYSDSDSEHPRDSLKVSQLEVKTTSLAAPGGQQLQVWHLTKTQEAVGPREQGQEGSGQRGGKTPIFLEIYLVSLSGLEPTERLHAADRGREKRKGGSLPLASDAGAGGGRVILLWRLHNRHQVTDMGCRGRLQSRHTIVTSLYL